MANNDTKFSEGIDGVTPEERAWIESQLDVDRWDTEAPEWEPPVGDVGAGFDWAIEQGRTDRGGQFLWIYSEASGYPENAARFVQGFLAKFRTTHCFSLTYSNTCTSPRIGEFAGGAIFVTADQIREGHAYDWISRKEKEFLGTATSASTAHPDAGGGVGPVEGGAEAARIERRGIAKEFIFEEEGVALDSPRDSFCKTFS
jgi:hypothetical protein